MQEDQYLYTKMKTDDGASCELVDGKVQWKKDDKVFAVIEGIYNKARSNKVGLNVTELECRTISFSVCNYTPSAYNDRTFANITQLLVASYCMLSPINKADKKSTSAIQQKVTAKDIMSLSRVKFEEDRFREKDEYENDLYYTLKMLIKTADEFVRDYPNNDANKQTIRYYNQPKSTNTLIHLQRGGL